MISRVMRYSGTGWSCVRCAYGPITLCGRPFQVLPLASAVSYRRPYNPSWQASWFGPLPLSLAATGGISSISFPLATKMFLFTRFASLAGYGGFSAVGCPIRTSRDHSFGAAPPGFSQLSASFIASDSLTIHRAPLGAYIFRHACLFHDSVVVKDPRPVTRPRKLGQAATDPAGRDGDASTACLPLGGPPSGGGGGGACGAGGGGKEIRTPDPVLAKHVLYQLSYTPTSS